MRGGVCAKADVLAPSLCHDFVCLTETWLSEGDAKFVVPHCTCYSACRPIRDGPGRPLGGVSVYVPDQLHAHVELVKTAEDASYL